ncbi:MAG: prolipoprotein diacylglyceryl transferase family protein, partial [Candidatus Roizmanbacteria bacterium]
MIPVLFNAPFLKIYTFGFFLVLAFYWGLFWFWRVIKLTSYKEETMFDGVFVSLLGALISSRLFYTLVNFDQFGTNILKYILVNGYPGGSLYGFILGFFLTFYLFCKVEKISFDHAVDYIVSPLLLSFGIVKIGAFFSGIDPGTKTTFLLVSRYSGY